ncbi:MAG: PilZ domain-containing protein, partial [Parvibaculum sp.]|uniref:PilZ domain-containing protein n=1 Tax=Parvibaculum sp. TaxID=2024848 RepID=UPI001B28BFA5
MGPVVRTYEQLTGAEGRRMFYRAERFRPEQLFSDTIPAVFIDNERASLKNLSMTGIAIQSSHADGWDDRIGAEMPFEFRVGDARLFGGAGRVRRIEPQGLKTVVGLEFTSGYLDIPNIVSEHDNLVLSQALADPLFASSEGIFPEFLQLCTEIVNLFRSYKDLLESYEKRLKATGPEREQLLLEALIACEDRMVPQWK